MVNCVKALRNDFGKLLETGQFADARLICYEMSDENGQRKRVEIPVHKAILSARSEYFVDDFSDGVDELEIQGEFAPSVVKTMLSHVYSDKKPRKMDKDEMLVMYEAAKLYRLDIFEVEKIQSEMVIKNLPADQAAANAMMSGRGALGHFPENCRKVALGKPIGGSSKRWRPQIRMQLGLKQSPTYKQKMEEWGYYTELTLETDISQSETDQILITDLSLSVLNSAGEKVKTVTHEGFYFSSKIDLYWCDEEPITWEGCLDYDQICKEKLLPSLGHFDKATKQFMRYRQLVLLSSPIALSNAIQRDFAYLLKAGWSADARIICYEEAGGDRVVVPVHRCILAVRSKFFEKAFSVEMREAATGEVEIPPATGFFADTVQAMLFFVYSGAIPPELDHPTRIALFKAADFYGVEGLMDVCADQFDPTVTNCCDMLSLADFYDSKRLAGKILNFILANKNEVKATEEWCQLMESAGKELKTLCGHWLGETPVTVENCCEVLRIGEAYGNEELKKAALDIILANQEAVQASEGWRTKMDHDLKFLIVLEREDRRYKREKEEHFRYHHEWEY